MGSASQPRCHHRVHCTLSFGSTPGLPEGSARGSRRSGAPKGPRMAKSIALAADASRLASLLLSYIQGVCAFVAPRHPGASTAVIDRLSHSRTLRMLALKLHWENPAVRNLCGDDGDVRIIRS